MNNRLDDLTLLFVGLKMWGRVTWPWWECVWPTLLNAGIQAYVYWRRRKEVS